jgi:hypothetical protein
MSGAPHADASTTAKTPGGNKDTSSQPSSTAAPQKQAAQLEEDDEFEDFPVEGVCLFFPSSSLCVLRWKERDRKKEEIEG